MGPGRLETRDLMIDKREILESATSFSLTPNVVEKDYVLGWILAGINAHEELAESWVFKGGTCLKKCYFETYRFSEDLDFTLRNEDHLNEEFLRPVFEEVVAWVTEQSGLNIPADQLGFDFWDALPEIFTWILRGVEVPQRAFIQHGAGEIAVRTRVLPMSVPLRSRSTLEILIQPG